MPKTEEISKSQLTDKQEIFCQEYIIDFNATRAATVAGFSSKTAYAAGWKELRKVEVKTRISELKEERNQALSISQQDVLKELINWAYSDVTEFMSLSLEEVQEMPPYLRRLVTSFKRVRKTYTDPSTQLIETEERFELKFASKEKAMEMLAKHTGFYEADNKQKAAVYDFSNLTIKEINAFIDLQNKAIVIQE